MIEITNLPYNDNQKSGPKNQTKQKIKKLCKEFCDWNNFRLRKTVKNNFTNLQTYTYIWYI